MMNNRETIMKMMKKIGKTMNNDETQRNNNEK